MNVSLILIILLIGAIVTLLSGNKLASKIALFFSVVAFGASIYLYTLFQAGENIGIGFQWIRSPKIFIALGVDGLSLAMLLLTTALTPIIIFSSFGKTFKNAKNLYALILFMAFAMAGTFLAADGFLYYIFWELALIPIYFIALIWGNGNPESLKKAVVKFFIYTFAGSLFMLIAFIYMYQKAGSFLIGDLMNVKFTNQEQLWIFLAFFAAYAIKIPLIPFHTWQAKVYQKAPSMGTMLLSGIMLKMALYSIIRWQLLLAPLAALQYKYIFIGISVAGIIYGSIVALKQTDLKKMLAYSSLAHVGLIAAGLYTVTIDGLQGAVLQMIAHGFVVVGLFFAAEIIYRRYETQNIEEMGGIRLQATKFASMFMILVLASVALPGTFNFIGEFQLLFSLAQRSVTMAVLGGTTIILGAFYMLRMFQKAMLGDMKDKVFKDVTFNEGLTFVIIITVLLFFGLYPKPIIDIISPTLQETLRVINRY
ncbi:NADH-quinone oxidoreductase subunit M [Flavobacterium sp. NST-5]|uniref:NADH-quinone oxidoreductase subunit M n=1 Tax=Flavobacterium ichthyis TaxID=2698827 RepID=A0ABW9ZBI3_9FLAO|nr:NADH-quinone oxidoreductase subunit M [Flavobacterium ichthyis]NBL64677.1 NADH-quinone oxidoreductase subunit M [Flavobacterium ichthyis]